jgi:hypothetical protein
MNNLITYDFLDGYMLVYVERSEETKDALFRALDDLAHIYGTCGYEVDIDEQYMFYVGCFNEYKEFCKLFYKYLY